MASQEFYFKEYSDEEENRIQSINNILSNFKNNIYTVGLEYDPNEDVIKLLGIEEYKFTRSKPKSLDSNDYSKYYEQYTQDAFFNDTWRINSDLMEGKINIALDNKSNVGKLDIRLKMKYEGEYKDFPISLKNCTEVVEDSDWTYYVNILFDTIPDEIIESIKYVYFIYSNNTQININHIKIFYYPNQHIITIVYDDIKLSFKDKYGYNNSIESIFEYIDNDNVILMTIHKNLELKEYYMNFNLIESRLQINYKDIPIHYRNYIFKLNYDMFDWLYFKSTYSADYYACNFKYNIDGDKSNKKEKKCDVNTRVKMALANFHTQKERNKGKKQSLKKLQSLEYRADNIFSTRKRSVWNYVIEKMTRVKNCKILVSELKLIHFEPGKSFVELILTNSMFKNRFKSLYDLYKESLQILKLVIHNVLKDSFKLNWVKQKNYKPDIVYNYKTVALKELISYILKFVVNNYEYIEDMDKLKTYYGHLYKLVYENYFVSYFIEYLKPNKPIVVKKDDKYISNTKGLLTKNFSSSPFQSNNIKYKNSTNELQLKCKDKFKNQYDQSFHTNLHFNQNIDLDENSHSQIINSHKKKSNSSRYLILDNDSIKHQITNQSIRPNHKNYYSMIENQTVSTISRKMDYLNMLSQNTRSNENPKDSTLNLTCIVNETQDTVLNDVNASQIENKTKLDDKLNKNYKNKSIEGINKQDFFRKFEDYQEIYNREKNYTIKVRSKSSDLIGFNTKAFKNKDDFIQLRNVYEKTYLPKEEVSIYKLSKKLNSESNYQKDNFSFSMKKMDRCEHVKLPYINNNHLYASESVHYINENDEKIVYELNKIGKPYLNMFKSESNANLNGRSNSTNRQKLNPKNN